uniref:Uncharacterized protein n=1 Tax=Anopheles arabiensis TaxID=7173 RepID=A0A182IH94_ANOAR
MYSSDGAGVLHNQRPTIMLLFWQGSQLRHSIGTDRSANQFCRGIWKLSTPADVNCECECISISRVQIQVRRYCAFITYNFLKNKAKVAVVNFKQLVCSDG